MTQSNDSPLEILPPRIEAIARAMERQNRELSDTLRQQSRDFFDALDRHQDQIDAIIHYSDVETLEDN